MLKVEELTKIFKSDLFAQPFVALDGVSFEIPSGSMVGFLGANGAGKTTSLKIVMDFIRATSGRVIFGPELGSSKAEIFQKIGFLPERPYFYPHLTGEEFLLLLGQISDLNKAEIRNSIKQWAPRFKIDHALNRPLRTYSKGMLQRIGFLSCVLHDPQFIILDEPLSGLDPIGRKELKDVIVEVYRSGKTVFFSTHIVSDVEEICDRVIFLQQGKLQYSGKVQELIDHNLEHHFLIKIKGHHQYPKASLLPGEVTVIECAPSEKDQVLKELVLGSKVILGIEQKRLSLEEIFYKAKS